MKVSSTLDDRGFRQAIGALSKVSGRTYADTMKLAGVGPSIKILALDPAAKPVSRRAMEESVSRQSRKWGWATNKGRIGLNKSNDIFFRESGSEQWFPIRIGGIDRKVPPHIWQKYVYTRDNFKRALNASVKRRMKRSGLTRKSLIQIAEDLQINLSEVSPKKNVYSANLSKIVMPKLGYGTSMEAGKAITFEMRNHANLFHKSPTFWRNRLQSAIYRRQKAIEDDMRRGVMQDMEQRAKRYPGLFIQG